jgi:hypothetical protein
MKITDVSTGDPVYKVLHYCNLHKDQVFTHQELVRLKVLDDSTIAWNILRRIPSVNTYKRPRSGTRFIGCASAIKQLKHDVELTERELHETK